MGQVFHVLLGPQGSNDAAVPHVQQLHPLDLMGAAQQCLFPISLNTLDSLRGALRSLSGAATPVAGVTDLLEKKLPGDNVELSTVSSSSSSSPSSGAGAASSLPSPVPSARA
eukprot:RCo040222